MALLKTPICELIRGSLKEKIPQGRPELFLLEWWQCIHMELLTAILSPSLSPKSGRWEMTGQGSFRYSRLPRHYSRMVEKYYSALPAPWHFFERCTKVIKREHWIPQGFTDFAIQRISFAKTQDTHFPLDRYSWLLAATWASSSPRNIHVICWTANSQDTQCFANNILNFANMEKKKVNLPTYLISATAMFYHMATKSTMVFFLLVDLNFQNSFPFDQIANDLIWRLR